MESYRRYNLARELARSCPSELGREIALTGSAARGVADEGPDIELNIWVDALPGVTERAAWLRNIGATRIIFDAAPIEDGSVWATFLYQDIWVEAGWQRVDALDATLRELLSGRVTDHDRLIHAWIVLHAVPLRDTGVLCDWQQDLQHYPDGLQERLIAAATELWMFPHAMEMRWTLARRGDRLALAERLVDEVHNVLRALFALNRQWEPYWKWIEQAVEGLAIKPERLNERIDGIFTAPYSEGNIALCLELIRDTLVLVPATRDVVQARRTIEESLRGHGC